MELGILIANDGSTLLYFVMFLRIKFRIPTSSSLDPGNFRTSFSLALNVLATPWTLEFGICSIALSISPVSLSLFLLLGCSWSCSFSLCMGMLTACLPRRRKRDRLTGLIDKAE